MKKIVLIVMAAMAALFGQVQPDQSYRELLFQKFAGIERLKTINEASSLKPVCQTLSNEALELGYRTIVTDFNAKTGITTCEIVNYQNGVKTGFSASTYNEALYAKTNQEVKDTDTVSYNSETRSRDNNIKVQYIPQTRDYLTLSKFIASMMTLDPEIIDFDKTRDEGLIEFKSSISLQAIDLRADSNFSQNITNDMLARNSVADKFNKANLAYYSNLFSNMSEIYGYVQNLLFVFIGLFFVGRVGFDKGLRALDKSKESGGETQWLGKFYIPVIAVGFFFAPIPEDAGMNATIVQKMIRFMTLEANVIADKASAIGVNTYLQKLYASVGATSVQGEMAIRTAKKSAEAQVPIYRNAINGVCKERFSGATSFLGVDQNIVQQHERIDFNNVTKDSNKQEVTFAACRQIEYRMMTQREVNTTNAKYIESIEKTYASGNNELRNLLTRVNSMFQKQQDQLGWPNAIIIPSASILIESLPLIQNASMLSNSTLDVEGAITGVMRSEILGGLGQATGTQKTYDMGELIGKIAYLTLPGSRSVYESLKDNKEEALIIANKLREGMGRRDRTISPQDVTDKMANKTYIQATSIIYEWAITKIPIIVSVIAGIIAFIGYVIELAKYFYISPFVVVFALTTKKTHKIIDFLVTGLTIFFKPLLLVIFIFFSLFIHSLVQDIFLNYSLNQFSILREMSKGSELGEAVLALLSSFLQIFGSLGAAYVMWKLILTGPSWAMKLVGVDGAQNDMISEALSQRMDRAGFRM
ncbi:MAG: hypothetical protein LBJ88_04165 [Campylobacteraceae bacterium]|jgi:hypothetical protein|nr:hypothetical protein [Campylobacteraceae bacterium]